MDDTHASSLDLLEHSYLHVYMYNMNTLSLLLPCANLFSLSNLKSSVRCPIFQADLKEVNSKKLMRLFQSR